MNLFCYLFQLVVCFSKYFYYLLSIVSVNDWKMQVHSVIVVLIQKDVFRERFQDLFFVGCPMFLLPCGYIDVKFSTRSINIC